MLERWGDWVFDRGESQEWLNENLKSHTPFPKDGCVSCFSDTGFVSLPESAGGNRDFGERAPADLRFLWCGTAAARASRANQRQIHGAGNPYESAHSGGVDP